MPLRNVLQAAVVTCAIASVSATLVAQRIATDLTGNWSFKVVTENGTGTPAVTMQQKGDSLSGTYESARMGALPFKGTVKDKSFSFAVSTSGGATLTFTGVIVSDDEVKGEVDFGGQGGATFSGERKK